MSTEGGRFEHLERERVREAARAALFNAPKPKMHIGRFAIVERIGEGAFGIVYLALDTALERRVAIKVLRSEEDARASERLLREAKAMAQLSHANVITIHEVGDFEGRTYIAMAYVEGATLREWLARASPSWRTVLRVFIDAGRGLVAAHAAGIIHRDFKPENVLIDADERVMVGDFGLARSVTAQAIAPAERGDEAPVALHTTQTGLLLGTPAYLAPEVLHGARADERSDQFSFAVAAYEALAGGHPFPGSTPAARMRAIALGMRRETNTRGPRRLYRVLERALEVDPAARYPDLASLLGAMEDAARPLRWPWGAAAGVMLVGVAAATVNGAEPAVPRLAAAPAAAASRAARPIDAGTPDARRPDTAAPDVNALAEASTSSAAPPAAQAVLSPSAPLDRDGHHDPLATFTFSEEPGGNDGIAALDRGDYVEAVVYFERRLHEAERAHGSHDLALVGPLDALGIAHFEALAFKPAATHLERAVGVAMAAAGRDDPALVRSLAHLARVQLHVGDKARALENIERARTLATAGFDAEGVEMAEVIESYAVYLRVQRDWRDAVVEHRKGQAILEAAHGPNHRSLIGPLLGEATALLELRRPVQALGVLERVVALAEQGGSNSLPLAKARFFLATALWDSGGDRVRAVELAKSARAIYLNHGLKHGRLDQWLASASR